MCFFRRDFLVFVRNMCFFRRDFLVFVRNMWFFIRDFYGICTKYVLNNCDNGMF